MTDFLELVKTRKSIRSFSDQPVSCDLVEKILTMATFAPTACNQQLWNFTVVTEISLKEKLVKEASSSTLIKRAPVVVIISYDGWSYKEAIQSGSLAVGNILLASSYYGVGSLPINSYGEDSKIKEILKIPGNQTICCFVLLGYPDERAQTAPVVPRRIIQEVIHWEYFSPKRSISYCYDPETWDIESLIAHQKHYCRKTFLGKEMDLISNWERGLVQRELKNINGPMVDFLSYDGAYLQVFPLNIEIATLDLCEETAEYTLAAARFARREITAMTFDQGVSLSSDFKTSTLLFKLERLPKSLRNQIYQLAKGELIIIVRKHNLFLTPFFWLIRFIFGSDIRRTGIFAFFGPYLPVSLPDTLRELRLVGFQGISWNSYFLLPPFFEQIYQMLLQYQASGGSSYLHRDRRVNLISKLIDFLLRCQGFRRFGIFGSVAVIRCRK